MTRNTLLSRRTISRAALIAVVVVLSFVLFNTSGNVGSMQSRAVVNQDTARGMYRGVKIAERFDVSPPLRTMKGYPAKEELDRDKFEERKKTGFEGPLGIQDIDEAVQSVTTPFAPLVMPTPLLSFDAILGCSGCAPPDPVGDVGPNHYVAMSNSQFRIFNKTGGSVFGPVNINTLWSGFGGACQTENAGDPVVIYDQLDDRWILTQFTAAGPTYFNCVAISTTGDPTGTYYRYAFSTGTNFPDYPKYGMWGDALYISTREFAGSPFVGVGAYAVNRAQLVAGNPAAQVISFLATPASSGGAFNVGDGLLPSDLDGSMLPPANSPNYFVGSMDSGASYGAPQDALSFWKFTADFVTPANSTFVLTHTLPVAAVDTIPAFCSGRSCIPQPGTTFKVDHLGYRQRPLHRLAYRNFGTHESLVTNQSVEASTTMSGIRWYELRVAGGTPSIYQQGTYAPGTSDGVHRWMGSIAMDANGNMALGYSASDATAVFPSLRYTGRLAGDALGTMPQGEASIHAGTGSQTGGGNRWGDYTSMNIDSTDDCTFWYVNEYLPTTSAAGWRLRVGSFKFPSCSLGPNFSLAVTPASQEICAPANAVYTVNTASISGFTDPVTLSATGNPAGTTVTFSPNPVTPGNSSTMTVSNTGAGAPGLSTINVLGTSGALTQNQNVALNLYTSSPGTPTLTAPANGATGVAISPTFTWTAATQAKTYTLEIATDAGFTNIVHTGTGITGTTYSGATLSANTPYFWRVRGVNPCGTGSNSAASSFTTALICSSTVSYTGPAVAIPDNVPAGVNINLPVTGVGAVTDLNFQFDTAGACDATVGNVNAAIDNTFIGDLSFKLTPPDGSPTVTFQARRGGTRENICLSLLDDEGGFPSISTLTSVSGSPQSGNFAPETTGMFSLLDGESANGTWVLNVSDNAGADTGSMRRFSLIFNTGGTSCGASPTPTTTNTLTPTTTATNTFTPTATATNTFTPTATATNTFTPTATSTETFTPTDTPTHTPTDTPTPPAVINGTVTYSNAVGAPSSRPVSNVLISAAGSPNLSDTTGAPGTYSLTGFGAGSYTVSPSKSGGDNGFLTSFDAARIAQYVSGNTSFTTAQTTVADVSSTGGVSSFDAALIARYVASLGSPTGNTGSWIFNPADRNYPSVTTSIPNEDYAALLMGEVSGNWIESGGRPTNDSGPEGSISIGAPHLVTSVDKEVIVSVSVDGAANKGIISYEFDLRYDASMIMPQTEPIDVAGTVSRGFFVVVNTIEPGLLRVVLYGPMPIEENGVLLNLKFTAVGTPGSVSSLTWERLMFNERAIGAAVTGGRIKISAAAADQ